MQDVSAELVLVGLEQRGVETWVEMGRNYFVVVFCVHVVGVDFLDHFAVEVLLEEVFVLFAESDHGRVE